MRALVAAALVLASNSAFAQVGGFDIEHFELATGHDALLDVESAGVPAHGTWGAGAWLGFAHDPLVAYRDGAAIEALVDRRLATGFVGSLALWNRLELGIGIDVVGYQSGADAMELPAGGLGNARATAKLRLVDGRVQLAIVPTLTIPGGKAEGFLREAGPAFAPALALSTSSGRLRTAVNAGYRIRKRVDFAGIVVDDEVFARGGLGIATRVVDLSISLSAAAPVRDRGRNQIAIESLLGASRAITPMIDAFAAGGIGLDNAVGTPDWRALAGFRIAQALPRPIVVPSRVAATPAPAPVSEPAPAPAAPGTIDGTVVDHEGLPISGAVVHVTGQDISATTDDDGKFQLPAPAGPAKLAVERAEYQPAGADATVVSGSRVAVKIELARKIRQGQLRGQVLAFDGKPLAATITVTASGATIASATADAKGEFQVDLPAGMFEVAITAEGHIAQKRTVKVKLDGVTVLNIDMRSGR